MKPFSIHDSRDDFFSRLSICQI